MYRRDNQLLKKDLLTSAFAACLMALVGCPFLYVVIDITISPRFTRYTYEFYTLVLPQLLVAGCFLFWRYFSKPALRHWALNIFFYLLEGIGWYVIAVVFNYVSLANLQTGFESLGFSSILFLLGWIVLFTISLRRDTNLKQRLACIPPSVLFGMLLAVLTTAMVTTVVYLMTPTKFI